MSYKIADFTNKHKVSYVTNGVEKFASAVKIGNTNQFGWYEPSTPTEKAKLHTYLDFNDFDPNYLQICLKSKRTWSVYGWNGIRRRKLNGASSIFPTGGIELKKGHAPLTNRTPKNSFGNNQLNDYSNGKLMSDFRWWGNCELERHNAPFVGTKYSVSFWMYVKQDYRQDSFVFYQNNCKWIQDDEKDDKLRFLNNLSSNQLEVNTQSFNRKSSKVTITQRFNDFKANNNKFGGAFNYGGLKFEIPHDTWVFVTVSMNMNKMFVCYNDQIATSRKFKYSDIKYDNTTTNKVGYYSKKDAYKQPGRNYNFNTIEDKDRLLGLGIKRNSIQIADFRIYSNIAFTDPVNKIIAHIQNHRNQVGDLPQVLKPGFTSAELSVKDEDEEFLDDEFFEFGTIDEINLEEKNSTAIENELQFALNDSNELNSRNDALKNISQKVNVDYDLLYDQILDEGLTNLSF